MKLVRWKDDLINIENLRNIEYSSTNGKACLYFKGEGRVVEVYVNNKDLNDFYAKVRDADSN